MNAVVDTLLGVAGQIGNAIASAAANATDKQQFENDLHTFYKEIEGREEVQNMLTKYRLHLFQMREVNAEVVRRANMASTRAGRVQQVLGERADCMQKLHALLAQPTMDTMAAQLEEAAKRIHDIERHALQIELAMAALEKVVKKKENGCETESDGEEGEQQRRRVRWESAETEKCV
ncbi:hypothetical protein niasHT_005397 [Heterodera trifolii]|uniref:Uncharacterized protein n=1 Tax=Heterodera trifolii TaxID=157864 RepID=A0ABD2M231_9BILA